MLLLFLEDDVRSLLYWSQTWHRKTGLRVVTWNIAGQSDWNSVLGSMEPWKPDIVFLQETPDGDSSITTGTLSGYWKGYYWWDQGDCGILCRYPITSLPSGKVGPWDKPALALADVSRIEGLSTKTIMLSSVRLMMPVNAIYPGVVPGVKDHEIRMAQYTALATLLMEQQQKHGADAIIVGGDFNVRGNSDSLRPLWNAGLSDVWNTSGRGWGGTILSDFPVARIDHIYTNGLKGSTQSAAVAGKGSDHRLVVSEIQF
jgi:endonuclease/exonuclease/phosphatase (EEP) superfamily protein YafD